MVGDVEVRELGDVGACSAGCIALMSLLGHLPSPVARPPRYLKDKCQSACIIAQCVDLPTLL